MTDDTPRFGMEKWKHTLARLDNQALRAALTKMTEDGTIGSIVLDEPLPRRRWP